MANRWPRTSGGGGGARRTPSFLSGAIVALASTMVVAATTLVDRSSAAYTGAAGGSSNVFGTITLAAPTGLVVSGQDDSVTATWSPPATFSGDVAGYRVTLTPGGATCTTVAPTTSCTVNRLVSGMQYSASVVATNTTWFGPAVSANVTPIPAALSAVSLSLWLDGSDASTLISSSACTGAAAGAGTTIGCWKDKSTKLDHAVQTTGIRQPVVGSLDGKTAPNFDGTDDYAVLDVTKLPTGTTPSVVYAVTVQEDTNPTASTWRHLIGWGQSGTGMARVVEKGSGSAWAFLETYATWPSASPTRAWPTSTATLFDGVVTSTSVDAAVGGVLSYTYAATNNTGTSTGATLAAAPWATGQVWKGRIGEVVVVSENPSSVARRAMREYLALKWGLVISPSRPQSPSAIVAGSTATVSWSAPIWNGGAAITSYTVTPVGGPGSCVWSSGITANCTGLTGGPYTLTVTAVNAAGAGDPAST